MQKRLSCLLALPSDSLEVLFASSALKAHRAITGGRDGINLAGLRSADDDKRATLLHTINNYFTFNYASAANSIATALGGVVRGDYVPLMTLPVDLGWQVFETTNAAKQLKAGIAGLVLVKMVKEIAGSETFPTLQGTTLALTTALTESNKVKVLAAITKFHALLNILDGTTTSVAGATGSVSEINLALVALSARSNSMPAVLSIDGFLSSVTAAGDLDSPSSQMTELLADIATFAATVADAVAPKSATPAEKLTADWMQARDLLEYLPGALRYFKHECEEDSEPDIAPGCKAYVCMSSNFMTAVKAYKFIRECPNARVCMDIDRSCTKFDRSCDSGCVIA